MSVLDVLLDIIVPHDCVACGAEGSLLCNNCANLLPRATAHPVKIGNLHNIQSVTPYKLVAKSLIWKLKSSGAQAAAAVMAARMAPLVKIQDRHSTLVMPVPTATGRVRQRGYDQARLLARALSRQTQLPYANCLSRIGQTHQVGADREHRLRQLTEAFRVRQPRRVLNRHIILVDDVVTTGATLQTAAACLLEAGALSIEAITFAQV